MTLKANSIYKHYKGKYYKVLFIANDATDSSVKVVVYEALYSDPNFGDHAIWVRPLEEFENLHDGVNPRFEFVCGLV